MRLVISSNERSRCLLVTTRVTHTFVGIKMTEAYPRVGTLQPPQIDLEMQASASDGLVQDGKRFAPMQPTSRQHSLPNTTLARQTPRQGYCTNIEERKRKEQCISQPRLIEPISNFQIQPSSRDPGRTLQPAERQQHYFRWPRCQAFVVGTYTRRGLGGSYFKARVQAADQVSTLLSQLHLVE